MPHPTAAPRLPTAIAPPWRGARACGEAIRAARLDAFTGVRR
jgi:hypothetical protein